MAEVLLPQDDLVARLDSATSDLHLGSGVLLALSPENGRTLVDLLRRADVAMHQAKRAGGGVRRCAEAQGHPIGRPTEPDAVLPWPAGSAVAPDLARA